MGMALSEKILGERVTIVTEPNGIQAVLAKSFARIFCGNSFSNGVPAILCDTDRIDEGDEENS